MESVESRIAELSRIIAESHNDSSVESAIIWAKAIKERSELQAQIESRRIYEMDNLLVKNFASK